MGQTEQQALEAGEVWWEAEMFRGRPDWQQLLDFQLTCPTKRERAFLDNETEQLCTMLDDWQVDFELKDLPEQAWDGIRSAGFLSVLIPKAPGRAGLFCLRSVLRGRRDRDALDRLGSERDGAQLAWPGRAAGALRHQGAAAQVAAGSGLGPRTAVLRADRRGGRLGCRQDARHGRGL